MSYVAVSADEFDALDGVDDWRFILGRIVAEFHTAEFDAGAALVQTIAQAATVADHHPDVRLTYPGIVRVQLTTHAAAGLTQDDVELARTISGLARTVGATAHVSDIFEIELALDTMDADKIRPFWKALLAYEEERDCLVDPQRRGPALWFQQMDTPRTERNRFHLDITIAHDDAEARVAAAIAAGGTLLSDRRAKAFWVLADADGNEACVCTWQDR